jgi:hypothetical protein
MALRFLVISLAQPKTNPEMNNEYFKQVPRSYLYYGYTTVVDPWE